jgi:Family of unknown function (DUF6232)
MNMSKEVVMALNSDTSAASQGGWVHYRGPRIVVTSRYIENGTGRYLVRDLSLIKQVHGFAHPARMVALICGAIELVLAAPLAAAYGSAALLCAGFVSAFGLAAALLLDGRRNPRWMALRGVHAGRVVTLFSTRDQREFGQVKRAVIRAVEANRPWQP